MIPRIVHKCGRIGGVSALRKSDIDYRSGFLRIERSAARVRDASGTHLVVQSPKSGSSVRLVAIPNDMLELLKATTQSIQRDNYLLTNTDTPMEPRTLQYRYRKLLERCGIRYRNFHALRHTYATRCMENCTVKDLWYTVALSRCDEGRSVR